MSNVNIRRAVENISSQTNVYTPLIEVIVNAIDAIESAEIENGKVEVYINRSKQPNFENTSTDIIGFTVKDNGIGFTEENRDAFDTLYTEMKIEKGGKGFGRFVCLKYYEDIKIESVFKTKGRFFIRKFRMGKNKDIIIDEDTKETETAQTGTTVRLVSLQQKFPDATVSTISRTLVENLLPFFVEDSYKCPTIKLIDEDEQESIILNDYIESTSKVKISEVKPARGNFVLGHTEEQEFTARVFKIYSPKSTRSKVNLVAHRRVVTSTSIHNFIPEFSEEFYDTVEFEGKAEQRNFIVKVYVFGDYLDEYVSVERGGFEFKKDSVDAFFEISQKNIERKASKYAEVVVEKDVNNRREKTKESVNEYVNEAPWYRQILNEIDYSELPYNPSSTQIESHLHQKKYENEVKVKSDVVELLNSNESDEIKERAGNIAKRVTESSRDELTHYIALRRSVLDIFKKSLEIKDDDKYEREEVVHDIIFPTSEDSDSINFQEHNLWIVDERLNFTEYLSSDKPLDGFRSDRPDILAFDKRLSFRGENIASNPVTIFEFKKPQRDDFVNLSSEDPIAQIIRYIKQIKDGKYQTPKGRNIHVTETTPFYGYIVCDFTKKVRDWAEVDKDMKHMPDNLGYYGRNDSLNLYYEVLSWDKVLRDAELRNKIFFQKLNI